MGVCQIENLTYDTAYAKCSLGKIIYQYFLEALIRKKKAELYLMGGNLEYKRHYGSIEENLYTSKIYSGLGKRYAFYAYTLIKEALSPELRKKLKAMLKR